MAFELDNVLPWGRSFDEYVAMFGLSRQELQRRILGCGDGPSSFNSVLTKRGGRVISLDPLYRLSAEEIRSRIHETYDRIIEQTRLNQSEFVWHQIASVEELGRVRMQAMEEFLSDYEAGRREGRYVEGGLPRLPFKDTEFDIALCSHFLFLYSEQLSGAFHIQSIKELCRVAAEARIFPLLELGSRKSRHVENMTRRLVEDGFSIRIEKVSYEFQKGGNEVMMVTAP